MEPSGADWPDVEQPQWVFRSKVNLRRRSRALRKTPTVAATIMGVAREPGGEASAKPQVMCKQEEGRHTPWGFALAPSHANLAAPTISSGEVAVRRRGS